MPFEPGLFLGSNNLLLFSWQIQHSYPRPWPYRAASQRSLPNGICTSSLVTPLNFPLWRSKKVSAKKRPLCALSSQQTPLQCKSAFERLLWCQILPVLSPFLFSASCTVRGSESQNKTWALRKYSTLTHPLDSVRIRLASLEKWITDNLERVC